MIVLDEILDNWKKYLNTRKNDEYVSLYIDIPFCMRLCEYCIYKKFLYEHNDQLINYLENLNYEMELFSDVFKNEKIKSFYIGGGTPSTLTTGSIITLFNNIKNNFNIDTMSNATRCFEIHPDYFLKDKMDAVIDSGLVNRLSFGIQNFDAKTVEGVNRDPVSPEFFESVIKYLRERKPDMNVNVDLLIGLKDEKPEDLIKSFGILSYLNIPRITVYSNRNIRSKEFEDYSTAISKEIEKRFDQYDCNQSSDRFAECRIYVLKSNNKTYDYPFLTAPGNGNSVLGLGPQSRSFIDNQKFSYMRNKAIKEISHEKCYFNFNEIDRQFIKKFHI